MIDRALDAALGEELGLCRWVKSWRGTHRALVSWAADLDGLAASPDLPLVTDWNSAPTYSRDLDLADLAETRLIERGLGQAYEDALMVHALKVRGDQPLYLTVARTDAHTRCCLMLDVVRQAKDSHDS